MISIMARACFSELVRRWDGLVVYGGLLVVIDDVDADGEHQQPPCFARGSVRKSRLWARSGWGNLPI